MTCTPRHDADVLAVQMPGEEMVLLHHHSGRYFSLNETGSLIWKKLEDFAGDAEIAQELVHRFDVTPEAALEAVRGFLHELQAQRLITFSEERPA
jgi:hypothetical protein